MASVTSKPWGGAGAWALDSEEAEAEGFSVTAENTKLADSFPSLREAVAVKPKKKKGTTLSLSEFATGTHVGPFRAKQTASSESKRLTTEELLELPTGPMERTQEELERTRLGGGFRNYGGRREEGGGRRGFGDDEQRRGPPRRSELDDQMPSRADEADNWASLKKPLGGTESGRRERYGELGSGGGPSRADEVDSWSMGKKLTTAPPPPGRYSGFGSGFRESATSSGDSDRWVRGGGVGGSVAQNGDRERPRLVLNPPKRDSAVATTEPVRNRPNPFAAARPREEVLSEKGVDWRKAESEIETKKTSDSVSPHSTRPSSANSNVIEGSIFQSEANDAAPRPRQKVNPFGDAKPREVLLEEKGKDWRKIDIELEQRRVDRAETEDEKLLKEEITHIKKELSEKANNNGSEELDRLQEQLVTRERELEILRQELDNNAKFGQKTNKMQPDLEADGGTTFTGKTSSEINILEDSTSAKHMDRPGPHGNKVDAWNRFRDDGRASQVREERFPSSRNVNGYMNSYHHHSAVI